MYSNSEMLPYTTSLANVSLMYPCRVINKVSAAAQSYLLYQLINYIR